VTATNSKETETDAEHKGKLKTITILRSVFVDRMKYYAVDFDVKSTHVVVIFRWENNIYDDTSSICSGGVHARRYY
jgi:hypothetical protein